MRLIRKRFIRCNGHVEKEIMIYLNNILNLANEERIGFLRNLFHSIKRVKLLPIEEVESVESIVQPI